MHCPKLTAHNRQLATGNWYHATYLNLVLYTLTGASASVWIVCLVIHSIFYKSISNPDIYKIIALSTSLLISANFVIKKKRRRYEDWLLSIINGFLIFIY